MANMLFANNANTTLASSLTNVATTMSVTSATGFPSPTGSQYFYCTLTDAATQTTIEIVKVTAVSGTTFTIVRGQDGTTGTIFASGAVVSLRLVRANLDDFPKLDEVNTFTGLITASGGINTATVQATNSGGLSLKNSAGTTQISMGGGGGDNVSVNVSTNLNGTNAQIDISPTGTGHVHINPTGSGSIEIAPTNVGTINNMSIGATTASTGKFTALTNTALTSGRVTYAGTSGVLQDSANLVFDGQNVGLSTTPSAWGLGNPAIDMGSWVSFGVGTGANASWNAYYDGANWKRKLPYGVGCSLYTAGDQSHLFQVAPASTAGSTISWITAMQIGATGGVSIGNTTDPGATNLSVTGTVKTSGALLGSSTTSLNDYQEGTFTPTYSSWTINPTTSNAFYTKIGRQVTINMLCAEGVTVGGGIIGNLPFTSKANQGATATIRGINSNINGVGSIPDGSTQIQNIGAMTNTGYYWTLSVTYIV